jgi:hypothetical protein
MKKKSGRKLPARPRENRSMNLKALTVAQLEAAHAEALASLARVGSDTLHRTRLKVLGAVSAELANRRTS